MPARIDFFYDVASPFTYLTSTRIDREAQAAGVEVRWRPFLLGGVFKATHNTAPANNPARGRYMLQDLTRWAARLGVPFQFSASFPHNSLMAMRALTAAAEDERVALSHAVFRAAWAENRNISDAKVLAAVLGDRAEALLAATSDPAVKAELMKTTQEAIDAGAFGAPTFLVNGELHFGNDRLDFALEAALKA